MCQYVISDCFSRAQMMARECPLNQLCVLIFISSRLLSELAVYECTMKLCARNYYNSIIIDVSSDYTSLFTVTMSVLFRLEML